jgi:hypothetical protein
MGDFRITIEGVGNHGCARDAKAAAGDTLTAVKYSRCHRDNCVDCQVERFVEQLKARGTCSVAKATLEHWPVPGAGCTRTENPGPIDDMLDGTRLGTFQVTFGQQYIPGWRPRVEPMPPVEVPTVPDGPGPATVVDSGAVDDDRNADLEL